MTKSKIKTSRVGLSKGEASPALRGSATVLILTATVLTGIYLLLIGLTVAISLAHLSGYTVNFSGWSFAAYKRVGVVDIKALAVSLVIACFAAALSILAAFFTTTLISWWRRTDVVLLLLLPGFLCCPALRAITLPILDARLFSPTDQLTTGVVAVGMGLLCACATAFPFCLAICALGAGRRLNYLVEVYRNLGGSSWGSLNTVALPILRPSLIVSFLVATPVVCFDPYSLRVAGAQVLPSVGALLIDLRSASDWPFIAVICLISLFLLLPLYVFLLPMTTRNL